MIYIHIGDFCAAANMGIARARHDLKQEFICLSLENGAINNIRGHHRKIFDSNVLCSSLANALRGRSTVEHGASALVILFCPNCVPIITHAAEWHA